MVDSSEVTGDIASSPSMGEHWAIALSEQITDSFVSIHRIDLDGNRSGTAAGAIIEGGLVVTCLHAISCGREIEVILPSGAKVAPTVIVATDPYSDLAILELPAESELPHRLPIRNSSIPTGSPVAAMGNPGGDTGTFVTGVISRYAAGESGALIPLSLAIEQGNSGGPVVDPQGNLIGIVALKDLRRPGLGYAIPMSMLQRLLENRNPVPYQVWIDRLQLAEDRWRVENPSNWSRRGGRIRFERSPTAGHRKIESCYAQTPGAIEGKFESFSVEIQNSVSPLAAAGAFLEDKEGNRLAWNLSGGRSVFLTSSKAGSSSVELILEEKLHEEHIDEPWLRLSIQKKGDRLVCYVNRSIYGSFSIPKWLDQGESIESGIQANGFSALDFRSFATFRTPVHPNERSRPIQGIS
ncbi:MAG: S1C family serine protease, partial [Verrucomicrobiota bacterium]